MEVGRGCAKQGLERASCGRGDVCREAANVPLVGTGLGLGAATGDEW